MAGLSRVHHHRLHLTAGIYVGAVLGEALFFNLSWWWATRHGLLVEGIDPGHVRAVARRYLLGPVLYLVAFAAVFVNAVLSLVLYLLLVFVYVIPGAGDLPAAKRETDLDGRDPSRTRSASAKE